MQSMRMIRSLRHGAWGVPLVLTGMAQAQPVDLGAAASVVYRARSVGAGAVGQVRNPIAASLSYDGASTWGFSGQAFGDGFDEFDTSIIEEFEIAQDANLTEFRSAGFGLGDPFQTTDIRVAIWTNPQDGSLPGQGASQLVLASIPGVGFWDGDGGVSDFGAQCLPAGCYFIVWQGDLFFFDYGQILFYAQAGPHDVDGGCAQADSGVLWNPNGGFGMGEYFDAIDGGTGQRTGVNFVLCGTPTDCDNPCNDPNACGDWDGDLDSDADDFFLYLGAFAQNDPCADLDSDGDWDSEDFFTFLGRFVEPC